MDLEFVLFVYYFIIQVGTDIRGIYFGRTSSTLYKYYDKYHTK